MSQAHQQDANSMDPSVEDDRSNPADDRSADANHDKETGPESTPAPLQGEVEPEDLFLVRYQPKLVVESPSKGWTEISISFFILAMLRALIKNASAGGGNNPETVCSIWNWAQ
ncbi:hypothetical protein I350_06134 [Cryptococcus amylolentus CBS 6273]|uniref:Uncharacterized protein n=1 Tax=Cryptococcus amylolentus CBS 6273 TaxID=1296118 RepID=A0A1E3JQZ7_9TREE|nr:hypothetical protein I350_06134 [Cryptococcus amylolentus CBS 6273]